jgi:serine/threonine-protein kinase
MERTTGEHVAVKLLHESLLRQPKLVTRFVQERTILMMLRHENIVGVRDLFSVGESLGLVMDLVAGGSLREHLRNEGTLAAGEAARLLAQVAAALTEAHGLGVVHRDVKPDNILLQATDGRLDTRLTDFGIARVLDTAGLTTPHAVIGTPHYMAPEAISGAAPSPAADVYALGVVLYELVAGQPPYAGEPIAVLGRHLDDSPQRPPGMPDEVWSVITACMDRDPERRPPATELAIILRDLAHRLADVPALPGAMDAWSGATGGPRTSVSAVVRHPSAPRNRRPPGRRNRPRSWLWAGAGVVVALASGGLVASGADGFNGWDLRDLRGGPFAAAVAPPATAAPQPTGSAAAVLPDGTLPDTGGSGAGPQAGPPPMIVPQAAGGDRLPAAGAAGRSVGGAARVGVSAGPVKARVSAGPIRASATAQVYGPWRCGDDYKWDVGHPVLARPCYSVGGSVRVVGQMQASPGVQADVSLAVHDAETDNVVAGPHVCKGLMFTDFMLEQSCGPVDLNVPRGRRYVVVESWRYTSRSLLPGGTARGPEFTW